MELLKVLKKFALLTFCLSFGLLSSCGPKTFLGTWAEILNPSNSSPDEALDEPAQGISKSGYLPKRLKIKNFSKVIGISNRDRNLLMQDTGGQTGFSVATGDFNNDGFADIVMGAPESDGILEETTTSGWAYMIFGKSNFPRKIDLKHELSASFWGGRGGGRNRLGHALASSDLNGDGLTDLIIGAPHYNGKSNRRVHSGAIFVVFGKSNFKKLNNLMKTADLIILGANEGDLAGFSFASGNLNGDKEMDLIIGAPGSRDEKSAKSSAGAAYILLGKKRFPKVIDLAKYHNGRLSGTDGAADRMSFSGNMADQAGYSVLSTDVNSDGLDDVLIGAPFADGPRNKGEDVGEVYVVLGRKKFPKTLNLKHAANAIIYGSKNFGFSGKQLASGDINGDATADILISSPGVKIKSKNTLLAGVVFGVLGRKNWPKKLYVRKMSHKVFVSHHTTFGENYESVMSGENVLGFGTSMASMDLNGDRLDDLLIGVPGAPKHKLDFGAGSVDFFLTKKNGLRISSSGIFQPTRLDASESLGKAIVLGDINGDGQKDILIGAPGILQSKRSGRSGGAYVIFGPKTSS